MISNYIQNAIKDTAEIANCMEKNITLKYKNLIKIIEKDLNFDQRRVERCIKTTKGDTPKSYFDKRKVTVAIDEIVFNPTNINKIYKKYNGKKELNKICERYFEVEIDEIIRNREIYILQDKIEQESLESEIEIIEDTIHLIKLTKLGKVRRKENIYKVKRTLDRMPVYAIPEFKYSEMKYQYEYNKINVEQFFRKIVGLDKIIRKKPKSSRIEFTEREHAIIEFCYPMYNLFKPVNIDGICYFGVDKNIIYRSLENEGIAKKTNVDIKDLIENATVRYLGNSISMEIDNEDSICYHFFTKDMESDLDKCSIDYYIDISKRELKEIIDRVYEKYKDESPDLKGLKEEQLPLKVKESLNKKIGSFRYGDIMTISLAGSEVVAINDFYPKATISNYEELMGLMDQVINTVERIYNEGIDVKDNFMASSYEIMNKIIRTCISVGEDVGEYMNINFEKFDKLEDLFVQLSYIYVLYITENLKEDELILKSKDIFEDIYTYMPILQELYEVAISISAK